MQHEKASYRYECQSCHVPMRVRSEDGMCCLCRAQVRVEVQCPACGKMRKVGVRFAKEVLAHDPLRVCSSCGVTPARREATKEARTTRQAAEKERKLRLAIGRHIVVNGCKLIPAREGVRCDNYGHKDKFAWCKAGMYHDFSPDTKDCMSAGARAMFAGWKCAEGSVPDLFTESEMSQIRAILLAAGATNGPGLRCLNESWY